MNNGRFCWIWKFSVFIEYLKEHREHSIDHRDGKTDKRERVEFIRFSWKSF